MTMYIRFHRGNYVDAVIPSAVGVQPSTAPGDVVWSIPSDINPSKTIQVTENVQATDPVTDQLLFNADGTPQWKTQTVTNPDGTTSEQIVTQQVPQTVYLQSAPQYFTPADLQSVATGYTVIGSLDYTKALQKASLAQSFAGSLAKGFQSSADGTERTYAIDALAMSRIEGTLGIINAGKGPASTNWYDINGVKTSFTPTQFVVFANDAFTFYDSNFSNLKTKEADVDSTQTDADALAVTW